MFGAFLGEYDVAVPPQTRLLMALAKRIFIKIFYHIGYKCYQVKNSIKNFPLGKDEENRLKLIDSFYKLANKKKIK